MQIDAALAAKLATVLSKLLDGKTLAVAAGDAGLSLSEAESVAKQLKKELSTREKPPRPSKRRPKRASAGLALIAYADGGSRGNPGRAACGVLITDSSGAELLRRAKLIGKATNNVAEYAGVLLALELCSELGANDVLLRLDSELVVRQLEGRYKVKHPDLAKLHARAKVAIKAFESFSVEHVPRAQNAIADKLANAALDGKDVD